MWWFNFRLFLCGRVYSSLVNEIAVERLMAIVSLFEDILLRETWELKGESCLAFASPGRS
jgi:hypothetical protein